MLITAIGHKILQCSLRNWLSSIMKLLTQLPKRDKITQHRICTSKASNFIQHVPLLILHSVISLNNSLAHGRWLGLITTCYVWINKIYADDKHRHHTLAQPFVWPIFFTHTSAFKTI